MSSSSSRGQKCRGHATAPSPAVQHWTVGSTCVAIVATAYLIIGLLYQDETGVQVEIGGAAPHQNPGPASTVVSQSTVVECAVINRSANATTSGSWAAVARTWM